MFQRFSSKLSFVMVAALAAGCVVGCGNGGSGGGKAVPPLPGLPGTPDEPSDPGIPGEPEPGPQFQCNAPAACNESIKVDANGPALIVTDPEVLAEFPVEKVVTHLLEFEGVDKADVSANEMLQRLFDTMNNEAGAAFDELEDGVTHCDSANNPATLNKNGDSFICPRPEGALAYSDGMTTAGHPDSFVPVAVINRFDLTPVDGSRCGQYRVIYAKKSGLTDPNNRVFVIFEAALANPMPGCLESCRPVAEFWKNLEGKSAKDIATNLRTFFFAGIPGFKPAIHPLHYGLGVEDQGYGGTEPGQVRVSTHINGSDWSYRELHVDQDPNTGAPRFKPATVKNNPPAFMFDPLSEEDEFGMGQIFRDQFMFTNLQSLASKDVATMQMFNSPEFNGVESMLSGPKKNDYFGTASASEDPSFITALEQQISQQNINASCGNDPIDAETLLKRANALSCAGCHDPEGILGADRNLGCGVTMPKSLGPAHVNEKGELSPAMKEVFLPHRAAVLELFLQSCDQNAINGSLQQGGFGKGGFDGEASPPSPDAKSPGSNKKRVRTLGGSQSH
jgi:hypothetical protein